MRTSTYAGLMLLLIAAVLLLRLGGSEEPLAHTDVDVLFRDGTTRTYQNAVVHSGPDVLELRDDRSYRIIARVPTDSVTAVVSPEYTLLPRDTVAR